MARRLAALMFTDMVGYSALAFKDEDLASELLAEQREIVRQALARHNGRENDTAGDGFFIEFGSAVDAVNCAVAIQTALHERERHTPRERKITLRIGIHLGDILDVGGRPQGNSVNLAARIEPLAPAGGVCITRQVYDQVSGKVSGIRFKKLGQMALKNIKSGAEIFKVVLPWEDLNAWGQFRLHAIEALRFYTGTWTATTIVPLFVGCMAVMGWTAYYSGVDLTSSSSLRGPAQSSLGTTPKVDLSEGWSYLVTDSPTPPPADAPGWEPFDPRNTWNYVEKIKGRYWMKKAFTSELPLREPSIVVGLVAESHRAFLNGLWIGGSEHYGDLAFYSFDPGLLKSGEENLLMISAETRPTLNPGITLLPEVGAFLGEYKQVREAVSENDVRYHLLKSVYLVLALLTFLGCFGYACFYRSNATYFYCSLVLLLGAIHLAFYNTAVKAAFGYEFVRYLKVLGLSLTPYILCSAYLHIKGHIKTEIFNNFHTAVLGGFTTYWLLVHEHTPAGFVQSYNMIFGYVIVYSVFWVTLAFGMAAWRAFKGRGGLNKFARSAWLVPSFEEIYLLCALISMTSLLAAIKLNYLTDAIPSQVRTAMVDLSLATPFLFSVFMMLIATVDHAKKSVIAKSKVKRDELMLDLVHLVHSSGGLNEAITKMQERLCAHLRATRSSIYVFKDDSPSAVFRTGYAAGHKSGHLEISPAVHTGHGTIGYVYQNRAPLLIENIRRDPRFHGEGAKYPVSGFKSYRTGSCMVFPLMAGQELIGVITFADKQNRTAFSKNDFATALEVSSSLAILLDNEKMRRSLAG